MAIINYSQVPRAFMHCHEADCPLADSCLRRQAYLLLPPMGQGGSDIVYTLNPSITREKPCSYYLSDTPVRVARGFRKAHRSVPHENYREVQYLLMKHMSQDSFYRFRRGTKLIYPDVQEKILSVLRRCGAKEPVEFDAYEDVLDWGDRIIR